MVMKARRFYGGDVSEKPLLNISQAPKLRSQNTKGKSTLQMFHNLS